MEEFLELEAFKRYRQLTLETIANIISSYLFDDDEKSLCQIKGALDLARQIIRLPIKIRDNDLTRQMVKHDLKLFQASFVKKGLE